MSRTSGEAWIASPDGKQIPLALSKEIYISLIKKARFLDLTPINVRVGM